MKKSDYKQQIQDMNAEINGLLNRVSELNDELKTAKDKLNLANNTVAKQIEAFDKMCENYENQLKIQDKELARRLILIHYLEDRLNEIIRSDS